MATGAEIFGVIRPPRPLDRKHQRYRQAGAKARASLVQAVLERSNFLKVFSKFSQIEFYPHRCLDEPMETPCRAHGVSCRVAQAVMQPRFKEQSRFAPWFIGAQMA